MRRFLDRRSRALTAPFSSAVPDPDPRPPADWPHRWPRLADACGLPPDEPLLLALSGGADSVFLLHLLGRAIPPPPFVVAHVAHGLRGEESEADARFCAALAARADADFAHLSAPLDPRASDLERLAREARYAALAAEARRRGIRFVVTGHHSDDALETLMIRWLRGTSLSGLAGLARRTPLATPPGDEPVEILRPLLDVRRAEIRQQLLAAGLAWREDSSNRSPAFTRNRVRNLWLPEISRTCGPGALENLRAFHDAVQSFEDEVARKTAHVVWHPPLQAAAQRSHRHAHLGGCVPRGALAGLPDPLQRRTLWRLIGEGCGHPPSRTLLDSIQRDLHRGRCTAHSVGGGWVLQLRSRHVHLSPPTRAEVRPSGVPLPVPGSVPLADGRSISAEVRTDRAGRAIPRSPVEVELRIPEGPVELRVRPPLPGDRFLGLGAPGSRPLGRFLADAGVPRAERHRVPLVLLGEEIVWVAGVRPCDRYRVREDTPARLRLRLHGAAPGPGPARPGDFAAGAG